MNTNILEMNRKCYGIYQVACLSRDTYAHATAAPYFFDRVNLIYSVLRPNVLIYEHTRRPDHAKGRLDKRNLHPPH